MALNLEESDEREERKYRKFTPEQKLEIVLAGLRGDRQLLMLALFTAAMIAASRGEPFGSLAMYGVDTARAIGFGADTVTEQVAAVAMTARNPHAAALLLERSKVADHLLAPAGLRRSVEQ